MRLPRLLLLLCLLVGLLAVGYAARAHLREVRASHEAAARRVLRQDLAARAATLASAIDAALRDRPPEAVYDTAGRLERPAPPATARLFEPPTDPAVAALLARGEPARARALAGTSAERALVCLRRGDHTGALAEPALAGTDLALRVRLARFRAEAAAPDAAWVDDVGALLDGPSDRFARALLREAGVDAATAVPRARRAALQRLRAEPGSRVEDGHAVRVSPEDGRVALRRVAVSSFDTGAGPESHALPPPFSDVVVRGAIDTARVEAATSTDARRLVALYGLAAAILLVGTLYALVAIGRAHRLSVAKSDFVANVTHELKTPLANIRLYAESLLDGRVRPEDRLGFLETVLEEARRLDLLVEGLLHAARGARVAPESLDPAALLRETAGRWEARLASEGCALAVRTPALPAILGDREALARALGNLLDNARKYARSDRRVELSGEARDGAVRLTVRDRGPGIPVHDRARMLRPFTRLERADRRETGGTGLGLSLVAACMEAHGGRVEIGGAPGEGTAVTLVLPAEER